MQAVASLPSFVLDSRTREFYRRAMHTMQDGGLPFLVGGSYAFGCFTGIERHTKDFDVFILRPDSPRAAELFRPAADKAELTLPPRIGKPVQEADFADLLSGP